MHDHKKDRDAYLAHAMKLKASELEIRARITDWLPDTIIDAHAHANLECHVRSVDDWCCNHVLSTLVWFTLEESKRLHSLLYPGHTVNSLRFTHVIRDFDHVGANQYLLDNSSPTDRVAMFGLPHDVEYTNGQLRTGRYAALKMYYAYLQPPAKTIYEYFRPEILEEAQMLDIPIILHLPVTLTACEADLRKLLSDFPKLRVSLAHLGLVYTVNAEIEAAYRALSRNPNVFLDNSIVGPSEAFSLALKLFGSERIMYGSDEPLCLIRACVYVNPHLGPRLVADYPYHWVNPDEFREYGHLAKDAVQIIWQQLDGMRRAISDLPEQERSLVKDRVFYQNAKNLFGF